MGHWHLLLLLLLLLVPFLSGLGFADLGLMKGHLMRRLRLYLLLLSTTNIRIRMLRTGHDILQSNRSRIPSRFGRHRRNQLRLGRHRRRCYTRELYILRGYDSARCRHLQIANMLRRRRLKSRSGCRRCSGNLLNICAIQLIQIDVLIELSETGQTLLELGGQL